jgi:hypothetical protein
VSESYEKKFVAMGEKIEKKIEDKGISKKFENFFMKKMKLEKVFKTNKENVEEK